ncbi:MAG: hypothetical protein Q4F28_06255 [Eubacteriales bacterium]|nr:hypothetical protein [Eubacteriales bacterium]
MERLFEELQAVRKANDEFLKEYHSEVQQLEPDGTLTAEESLEQEMLFEVIDKMERMNRVIDYWGRKPEKEGVISRGADGTIQLDGTPVPALEEFEVLLYDKDMGQEIWTRTYVSFALAGETPCLVGLDKSVDVNGLRARLRRA